MKFAAIVKIFYAPQYLHQLKILHMEIVFHHTFISIFYNVIQLLMNIIIIWVSSTGYLL